MKVKSTVIRIDLSIILSFISAIFLIFGAIKKGYSNFIVVGTITSMKNEGKHYSLPSFIALIRLLKGTPKSFGLCHELYIIFWNTPELYSGTSIL